MKISDLFLLKSPAALTLRAQLVPSAAIEQIANTNGVLFQSAPATVDDLSFAEALAGLVLLHHDNGECLVRAASNPDSSFAAADARRFIGLIGQLRAIVDGLPPAS